MKYPDIPSRARLKSFVADLPAWPVPNFVLGETMYEYLDRLKEHRRLCDEWEIEYADLLTDPAKEAP